jgi:hypothetical protein
VNAIHDAGPAFPVADIAKTQCTGMSLRAYLAAKCPLTMEESAKIYGMQIDAIWCDSEHATSFCHIDASMRLEWADAMISKLSEPPST